MESENSWEDNEYTFVVTYMGSQDMYVQRMTDVVIVVNPVTIVVL